MFIIKRTTQKKHYFQKEEIQILPHWYTNNKQTRKTLHSPSSDYKVRSKLGSTYLNQHPYSHSWVGYLHLKPHQCFEILCPSLTLPLWASLLWVPAERRGVTPSCLLFLALWKPLRNWASGVRKLPTWNCESVHCLLRLGCAVFALSRSESLSLKH